MKKRISALVLSTVLGTAALPAAAALLEFDISGLNIGGVGNSYNLTGTGRVGPATFRFDTETGTVSDVAVESSYSGATYGYGYIAPPPYGDQIGLFGYDPTGTFSEIFLYINTRFDVTSYGFSLAVGESSSFSPREAGELGFYDPSGTYTIVLGYAGDPTVTVTRLADPVTDPGPDLNAVPLPAGLPLMLAGLGVLGLVRRRR